MPHCTLRLGGALGQPNLLLHYSEIKFIPEEVVGNSFGKSQRQEERE
jgi:hypothetical protein